MVQPNKYRALLCACAVTLLFGQGIRSRGDDSGTTGEAIRILKQQNELLQQQLKQQQTVIESLSRKVSNIEEAGARNASHAAYTDSQPEETSQPSTKSAFGLNKVVISGEGGAGFFKSGSEGQFAHGDFRVDEAKLFLETPVFEDVYFFTEINLMQRESSDLTLQLGECYLDFENVSKLWNWDKVLSLRLGRVDIPFGEEYSTRDAIDNPLISHSLTDFWGVDAGVELYGRVGKFSYVVAVQNGGANLTGDYSDDKSVAGRLAYDPAKWLHFSVSGLRTGDLAMEDYWSALWFASGWIVPIGGTNTTKYHADIVEGDTEIRLPHGRIHAFGGYMRYDDNDPIANNRRNLYFYSVEAVHDLTRKFYAGARFSQIFAPNGFPILGNGAMDDYMFSPATTQIWRLSLGLGYRWSQNLVVKAEYTFERGKELSGEKRDHEDFFGVEAAFKF